MKLRVTYLGMNGEGAGSANYVDVTLPDETPTEDIGQAAVREFNAHRGALIYPGEHYSIAPAGETIKVVTVPNVPPPPAPGVVEFAVPQDGLRPRR